MREELQLIETLTCPTCGSLFDFQQRTRDILLARFGVTRIYCPRCRYVAQENAAGVIERMQQFVDHQNKLRGGR